MASPDEAVAASIVMASAEEPVVAASIVMASAEEPDIAIAPAVREKRNFMAMKSNWVFVYWANGHRITADMLKSYGGLIVDECHSTEDRASVYVYVHVVKQVRRTAIDRFFKLTKADYNFRLHDMRDEGAVASGGRDSKLEEHVGMLMLAKHMREANPMFRPWTNGEAVVSRGLLYRMRTAGGSMEVDHARGLARTRLAKAVRRLEKEAETARATIDGLKEEVRLKADEAAGLEAKLGELSGREAELNALQSDMTAKRAEMDVVRVALDAKVREVDELWLVVGVKDGELGSLRSFKVDTERELANGRALFRENAAMLEQTRKLDERVRELEVANASEKAKRKRLASEMEAMATMPADKKKIAEENLQLKVKLQSVERELQRVRK